MHAFCRLCTRRLDISACHMDSRSCASQQCAPGKLVYARQHATGDTIASAQDWSASGGLPDNLRHQQLLPSHVAASQGMQAVQRQSVTAAMGSPQSEPLVVAEQPGRLASASQSEVDTSSLGNNAGFQTNTQHLMASSSGQQAKHAYDEGRG